MKKLDKKTQNKVKNLIKQSKEKGLIKSSYEAFKSTPVEQESHKGKIQAFIK